MGSAVCIHIFSMVYLSGDVYKRQILEESGVLSGAAPYEDLVNTDFAEKASTL